MCKFLSRLICISVMFVIPNVLVIGQERTYWPTREWRKATPEEEGIDSDGLRRMLDEVKQNIPQITSIIVIRHGYVVLEEYFGSDPEALMPTWCLSKSVISALLGIAKDKRYIKSVDQTVLSCFREFRNKPVYPTAKKLTIRHLLTMSSGLGASFSSPDPRLFESAVKYPPIEPPGTSFSYNESDPAIASLIISTVTKQKTVEFARKYLFGPLGIDEFSWGEDKSFSGGSVDLCLKPLDMARIGYLYLNNGSWDGKQIISADWVRESTSKQIDIEESEVPKEYQYGYYWWIYRAKNHRAVFNSGVGGQIIYFIPDLDLVYVSTSKSRTDPDPAQSYFPEKYIVPSIFSK